MGKIEINIKYCKGCELCISFCPKKTISLSAEMNDSGYLTAVSSAEGECTGCAICAECCPDVCIEVWR